MNQYFDYNPITGLNYFSGNSDTIIDIASIPQDFDNKTFLQKWLQYVRGLGVSVIDSGKQVTPIEEVPTIISNVA